MRDEQRTSQSQPEKIGLLKRAEIQTLLELCERALPSKKLPYSIDQDLAASWKAQSVVKEMHVHPTYVRLKSALPGLPALDSDAFLEIRLVYFLLRYIMKIASAEAQRQRNAGARPDKKLDTALRALDHARQYARRYLGTDAEPNRQLAYIKFDLRKPRQSTRVVLQELPQALYDQFGIMLDAKTLMDVVNVTGLELDPRTAKSYIKKVRER